MRKVLTVLGIGVIAVVAYTYGAKAGRDRYRDIKATVDAVWNDPNVKKARKNALKRAQKATKTAVKQTNKVGR